MTLAVLIADDERLVRSGFRLILAAEPDIEVVGEAENGARAVDEANALRPDVVLMDLRMPDVDGLESTRRLMRMPGQAPRVLIVTTFDGDELVYQALRAGASGFLLKDAAPEELGRAIRVVAGGECLLAPRVTRCLIEQFVSRPARSPTPVLETLTDRELDVLRLIARGLSNAEIAESLVVSETTVKTHVGHLFSKLDLRDRAQAVVAAYESGLVHAGDG